MSVNLSPLAGAGQQFFDDNGVILSGGKLYSYAAGTTTPQAAYTSVSGSTPHTNPIILNSAGRVATGEIWLTTGESYKFSLFTSTDVLIATWDNIAGINGTGITSNAVNVEYDPAGTGAVATTVQAKLRESVSLLDFGADPTGITPCSTQVQAAIDSVSSSGGGAIYVPAGTYVVRNIFVKDNVSIIGDGWGSFFKLHSDGASPANDWKVFTCADASGIDNVEFINVRIDGQQSVHGLTNLQMHGIQCRGPNTNWLIQGCHISNCGGDPIIVGKYVSDVEVAPSNIRIIGNTCIYAGRQALSVTECNGVSIVGNYVDGPLDLEANSETSKFSNCSVSGNVVRGNLNVNLYSADGVQDNNTVISGNSTDFITLVGCNNVVVSGNTISTSLRYGANFNVLVDGCTMPIVDKIGGEVTTRMVVRDCTISTSAASEIAFEIADIIDLTIDSCIIKSSDANGFGISHSNVKSVVPTGHNIKIKNCEVYGGVRGINVAVGSFFGVTNYLIEGSSFESASTNPAINKTGTGAAGGTFSLFDCSVNNQIVISKSVGLVSLVGVRFENSVATSVVLDGNTDPIFELDNWTFVTANAPAFIRNCINFVSLYMGSVHSVGTTNSITLTFSGNTGTPTVWIEGTNATSTSWFGTIPGTIRTGSYYNLLDDVAKRGQWWNGSAWTNIT